MSIQAVAWVLEHSEATLADRLVLIAIANHADGRGWNAWPAVDRIAVEARVDRRTVFRAIETLEAAGELTVKRRPGRPNIYGITALMGWQDVTPQGVADCHPGVTSTPKRGGRMSPEPSVTVKEPGAVVGFPERCPKCGHFQFDCKCHEVVNKEKAKEWIQALKQGERPA